MKIYKNNLLIVILLLFYGFLPVFDPVAYLGGCEIKLISYDNAAIGLAALSVVITALIVLPKNKKTGKLSRILAALLPIVHMLNWLDYTYHGGGSVMMIAMAACFVCSIAVSVACCDKTVLKTVTAAIAIIMLIPLFVVEPIPVDDGIVLERSYSMGDRYIAEVLMYGDSDENGKTVVKLYNNKVDADFGLFTVKSRVEVIYEGSWDERMDLQVYWTNLGTLMIDDKEYKID